jgi:5'(3')-deoxyribonucleotidase
VTSLAPSYVLGLDLDGVVADFYSFIRQIAAGWREVPEESLTENVSFGLGEWGFTEEEYRRLHRFAVTQCGLFQNMPVIRGAAPAIRRLANEGVRVRVVTHRLFIDFFHRAAVEQTVQWLDSQAIPYHDLCFLADKQLVEADIYVEDAPRNIALLQEHGKKVIAFTNSTNATQVHSVLRAHDWTEVEQLIRADYRAWCTHGLPSPRRVGSCR